MARLESATRTIAEDPEVRKKFAALALIPDILDAAAFRARVDADHALIADIVAKAKINVD